MTTLLAFLTLFQVSTAAAAESPTPAPAPAPVVARPAPAPIVEEASITASRVVKVPVKDPAARAIIEKAATLGGWFSSFTEDQVVLRVPAAKTDELLATAESLGTVVDRQYNRQDHSFELTDMRARLASREQMLEKYFTVLGEADANSVVTVEREITNLIAEIEGYKGRIRFTENQVAFAQVTVGFQFRDRDAPAVTGSSSFRWINTLNLVNIIDDMRSRTPLARSRGAGTTAPDGFAPYRKACREFRATTPDQVMMRVRAMRSKPKATLPFWKEAMKKRMLEAGYKLQSESDVEANGQAGYLLELTAPMGTEDDTYMIAFFPRGRRIVVFEAAGEVSRFAAHREAVLGAIQALEL